MTVRFAIECELDYRVDSPTEFLFNVQAAAVSQQTLLRESLVLTGASSVSQHVHRESGNRFVRASAECGRMTLEYSTTLLLEHTVVPASEIGETRVAELPHEVLPFVLPSRYCESDRLATLAHSLFGNLPRGYARVKAVCDWVHRQMRFAPGTTDSRTSAADALAQGTGVCRDFAHVTIALLRSLNIPARIVTGYDYGVDASYGPTDFHAYVEAFLENRWWIFDATRLCPRNGLVRIGTGRDAADVAFATLFGNIRFQGMRLDIQPVGAVVVDPGSMALSTAAANGTPQPHIHSIASANDERMVA